MSIWMNTATFSCWCWSFMSQSWGLRLPWAALGWFLCLFYVFCGKSLCWAVICYSVFITFLILNEESWTTNHKGHVSFWSQNTRILSVTVGLNDGGQKRIMTLVVQIIHCIEERRTVVAGSWRTEHHHKSVQAAERCSLARSYLGGNSSMCSFLSAVHTKVCSSSALLLHCGAEYQSGVCTQGFSCMEECLHPHPHKF